MSLLSLLFAASIAHAFPGTLISRQNPLLPSYDYVIVGGGTAGLVIANRLSENPKRTVLVIEAGPILNGDAELRDLLIPGTIRLPTSGARRYTWSNITSEPLPELNGRPNGVSAAKILGGASAVNGLGWGRAGQSDHNDWAEFIGDQGWNWNNMVKYYRKLETFTLPPPEYQKKANVTWDRCCRGRDGLIHASYPLYFWESTLAFIEAEKALGVPQKRDDGNGDNMGGVWVPSSVRPKEYTRSYSKREYYDPYKGRQNLHVLVNTTATRVLFDKTKRATGVEYAKGREDPMPKTVKAKMEVVMAAGTVWSTPLLQVSGLGDKKLLGKLGVPVVADLPLIGEGFQDHSWVFANYNFTLPDEERWFESGNATFTEEQLQLYLHNRTGVLTSAFRNRMMLLSFPFIQPNYRSLISSESSSPASKYLRPGVAPSYIKSYKRQRDILLRTLSNKEAPVDENAGGRGAYVLRPLSRGYIQARTSSIFDPPVVDWRTLSNPLDREVILAGFRFSRKYLARPELAGLNPREIAPGLDKQSDEELMAWLRANMSPSNGHTCCTLSLGIVTDSKARVKGVTSLRVADSSVWPFVPGAHATQQTAYVVAEKVADLIKDDAGR